LIAKGLRETVLYYHDALYVAAMTNSQAKSPRAAHPPKPRLTVRVGFAGERKNFDPELPGLHEQFAAVLSQIAEDVCSFDREQGGYDPHKAARLIFICSLAAGADQFAAKRALEAGYELQVPLAWPRKKYADMNFKKDSDELLVFNRLLQHEATKAILELDGSENEQDAYDAAGTVLVNHSDVLLAIWDLSTGNGPGGTGDSVRKAIAAGIPVIAFSSTEERPADLRYLDRVGRKPAELRELLGPCLNCDLESGNEVSEGQESKAKFDAKAESKHLRAYYREKERRIDLGLPYSLLTSLLRGTWSVRLRLPAYGRQASENWGKIPDERWVDKPREYFERIDMWADSLAVFYGQWMRGVVATSLVGGAIVVSISLAARFWPARFSSSLLPYLDLVPLLLAVLIVFSRYWGVQRRWMEYRMLSELLRSYALSAPIGGLQIDRHRFHVHHGFSRSWATFYYQAVIRNFGLCNAVMNDDYLLDYKHLLTDRLRGQIEYHDRQQRKCSILHRRIRTIGLFAFSFTLLACLPMPFARFVNTPHQAYFPTALHDINSFAYIFAIVSAAIAGFAAQENFARLVQVSVAIKKRLILLVHRLEQAQLDSDTLRDLAGEAIEITIQEHAGWILLSALREIEFSAG